MTVIRHWRPTKPLVYSTEFGKWLAVNMQDRGMSMRALSRISGINRSVIAGHVHGDFAPSLSAMYRYINTFGGDFMQLYEMLSISASQ